MRLDHRIRSAINKQTHAAGVEYAAKLRESLLERAKELTKGKTPPADIAIALALPFPSSHDPA